MRKLTYMTMAVSTASAAALVSCGSASQFNADDEMTSDATIINSIDGLEGIKAEAIPEFLEALNGKYSRENTEDLMGKLEMKLEGSVPEDDKSQDGENGEGTDESDPAAESISASIPSLENLNQGDSAGEGTAVSVLLDCDIGYSKNDGLFAVGGDITVSTKRVEVQSNIESYISYGESGATAYRRTPAISDGNEWEYSPASQAGDDAGAPEGGFLGQNDILAIYKDKAGKAYAVKLAPGSWCVKKIASMLSSALSGEGMINPASANSNIIATFDEGIGLSGIYFDIPCNTQYGCMNVNNISGTYKLNGMNSGTRLGLPRGTSKAAKASAEPGLQAVIRNAMIKFGVLDESSKPEPNGSVDAAGNVAGETAGDVIGETAGEAEGSDIEGAGQEAAGDEGMEEGETTVREESMTMHVPTYTLTGSVQSLKDVIVSVNNTGIAMKSVKGTEIMALTGAVLDENSQGKTLGQNEYLIGDFVLPDGELVTFSARNFDSKRISIEEGFLKYICYYPSDMASADRNILVVNGIGVGTPRSEVEKVFGEPANDMGSILVYYIENSSVTFYLSDLNTVCGLDVLFER